MASKIRIWTLSGPNEQAAELLKALSGDGYAVQTVDSDDPTPDEVVVRAMWPDGSNDGDLSDTARDLGFSVEESDEDGTVTIQRDVVLVGSDERLVTTWMSSDETEDEALERISKFFGIPAESLGLRQPLDLGATAAH